MLETTKVEATCQGCEKNLYKPYGFGQALCINSACRLNKGN